ncbi:hypothetical protein [Arthrobacter sp. FW306-2-2C-D06B]|uniref:hypothetical protein n=1 Tax=Arthrobacter sp. FW306-2-2C-D06B TaxID=2879618 RepID=UPI001F415388|nr:hypothetical protein [Arthrobacter sp. FW306-2-2C-D06B]UKA59188.1 hypothetical protein LFT47_02190 [Arthrobacter sp. FW306-2-2C-D06B]
MADPALRILSLGAGVQSSALLILAARGDLPNLDAAIFSDTGWEPASVYEHLKRLEEEVAKPAGIPIYRVSSGNIRDDALNPTHRFASMPLFIKNRDGGDGMTRRQCTGEYKLKPIKAKTRELLGAEPREDGKPGRVPRGWFAEQWIGISTDEVSRALDKDGNLKTGDVRYSRNKYPLLDLGMDRETCRSLLTAHGFEQTPKSACIGCPFHSNMQWRELRDKSPDEWADAVDFDASIRAGAARANAQGQPLLGQAFLHRSRLPLSEAPIDKVSYHEWAGRQSDVLRMLAVSEFEEKLSAADNASMTGCSPFSCVTGEEVGADDEEDGE